MDESAVGKDVEAYRDAPVLGEAYLGKGTAQLAVARGSNRISFRILQGPAG